MNDYLFTIPCGDFDVNVESLDFNEKTSTIEINHTITSKRDVPIPEDTSKIEKQVEEFVLMAINKRLEEHELRTQND